MRLTAKSSSVPKIANHDVADKLEPAPLDEVLRDQFEFLLTHYARHGTATCPLCRRWLNIYLELMDIWK